MTTLTKASNQWASRPADERFPSIEAMHSFCAGERALCGAATLEDKSLHAEAVDGAVLLNGKTSKAMLTNWAFGQLANRADAPAAYLRTLPATLAADCLNNGLKASTGTSRLLIQRAGLDAPSLTAQMISGVQAVPTIRAITSDRYDRIWNSDITARLVELKNNGTGWQEAPAAFDGSRGQYAGDRDCFSFFVDNDRRIFEKKAGGMSRGFFAWNSEVGSSVFGFMTFLYSYICGNHMVWNAENVSELRVRHVGDAASRAFGQLKGKLISYANNSAATDELKIQRAMDYNLGTDKASVLDAIFSMSKLGLPQKTAERAYAIAEEHSEWYGSPRSAWGYSNGLTEIARDLPNAGDRVAMERIASKIVELAF